MTKHKQGGASERLVAWAVGLSRPAKRLIMLTADGIMIPLALGVSFLTFALMNLIPGSPITNIERNPKIVQSITSFPYIATSL